MYILYIDINLDIGVRIHTNLEVADAHMYLCRIAHTGIHTNIHTCIHTYTDDYGVHEFHMCSCVRREM